MYEKILALLIAKFAQARKDGLQQLARSLAIQAADEAEGQALVDKLTPDKVTDFVKDWRKDVDAEVTNSNKTFETTLKGKYNFVEKATPTPTPSNDETPAWAKALVEQNKLLADKITAFETGSATATRKQVLEAKLAQAPEALKTTVLKNFGRMTFGTEEEFNEFVTETETDIATFVQDKSNLGLGSFPSPANPAGTKVTQAAVIADVEAWAKSNAPIVIN